MNPNLEFEQIVLDTVANNTDPETLGPDIVNNVRNWMSREFVVFYQP